MSILGCGYSLSTGASRREAKSMGGCMVSDVAPLGHQNSHLLMSSATRANSADVMNKHLSNLMIYFGYSFCIYDPRAQPNVADVGHLHHVQFYHTTIEVYKYSLHQCTMTERPSIRAVCGCYIVYRLHAVVAARPGR